MPENRETQEGKKLRMKLLQQQVPHFHPRWKEKDNRMHRMSHFLLEQYDNQ
jgi:hypothetical protein